MGGTVIPNTNINHPTIDPATNRFTTGQGYVYDFNGNLIQDAEGRSFTFNGDDKQTEVRDTATNQLIGQYFYDGSGARVKKHVPSTGETTVFVYDAGGALAAEYSTVAPPQNPTTSYLTTDHLGSPRVITDENGEVISRRDFMPFGEELYAGVGPRTQNLKYSYLGSDNIRQRFTGYEKDDETGLDFAEARMYQNKHGRFTAPDPLLASASAANPQTFNRYIYTGNNPVNLTDPSGLIWCGQGRSGTGFGDIAWQDGNSCSGKGWTALTDNDLKESYTCNSSCTIRGTTYSPGTVVRFNADGTHRAALADPGPQATVTQGQNVAAATGNIAGQNAGNAAASGSSSLTTGGGTISSNVTTRQIDDLPPLSPCAVICEEPSRSLSILDLSKAPGLKTVEAIAIAAEAGAHAPGLNVPFSLIAGIIRAGQGRGKDAAWNFAGIAPGVSWLRKADKAADATKGAHAVYQGVDKVTGAVKYVGITARDPAIRFAEHMRSIGTGKELLRYEVIKGAQGLTKMQARIWEQKLINKQGLGNLLNKINSIAPKYWGQHGIR